MPIFETGGVYENSAPWRASYFCPASPSVSPRRSPSHPPLTIAPEEQGMGMACCHSLEVIVFFRTSIFANEARV